MLGRRIFSKKYTADMDMKPGNIPKISMIFIRGLRAGKRMREKAEEIPIRQPADIFIPWADEDDIVSSIPWANQDED